MAKRLWLAALALTLMLGSLCPAQYPAWASELEAPYSVVSDDGRNIEFNVYTTSGLVLTLLLAIGSGMGLGVWHSRRTKLSPA